MCIYGFKQRPRYELKFNSEQLTQKIQDKERNERKIFLRNLTEILCKKRMERARAPKPAHTRYFQTREFILFAYPPPLKLQFCDYLFTH
jgi:hypothetical protein